MFINIYCCKGFLNGNTKAYQVLLIYLIIMLALRACKVILWPFWLIGASIRTYWVIQPTWPSNDHRMRNV